MVITEPTILLSIIISIICFFVLPLSIYYIFLYFLVSVICVYPLMFLFVTYDKEHKNDIDN